MSRNKMWVVIAIALGSLGLAHGAQAAAAEGWDATFAPDRVAAYLPVSIDGVMVVGAGTDPSPAEAAVALTAALRASRRFRLVIDGAALGSAAELSDAAIVQRAAAQPVGAIAILRLFNGEGARISAVVTLYDKQGKSLGALTGDRGTPIASREVSGGQGVAPAAAGAVSSIVNAVRAASETDDQAELAPSPGSVPVNLTSTGRRLRIGIITEQARGIIGNYYWSSVRVKSLCDSPCTLHLAPGPHRLVVAGEGVWEAHPDLEVPSTGAEVRLRSPSRGRHTAGVALVSGGAGAALVGGLLMGFYAMFEGLDPGSTSPDLLVSGGVIAGVGVAAMIPGICLLAVTRGGVASVRPLARVSLAPSFGRTGGGLAIKMEL